MFDDLGSLAWMAANYLELTAGYRRLANTKIKGVIPMFPRSYVPRVRRVRVRFRVMVRVRVRVRVNPKPNPNPKHNQ